MLKKIKFFWSRFNSYRGKGRKVLSPHFIEFLKLGWKYRNSWEEIADRGKFARPENFKEKKIKKLRRIRPLLREDMKYRVNNLCYDFLTKKLREEYKIVDTDSVSINGYDEHVTKLIEKHKEGLVLDCGSGKRQDYFDNVVNLEIADYDTTDVRGVAEVLPFKDNVFDAVVSMSVLEHVKNPFLCAKEIARVLKPEGEIICSVPFLQPLHAYPNHYYNMTNEGLKNLFSEFLVIDGVKVYDSVLPIWSLNWILKSWAEGLTGKTKKNFLDMKVSDLLEPVNTYFDKPFVRELPEDKNLELASATVLFAHKEK